MQAAADLATGNAMETGRLTKGMVSYIFNRALRLQTCCKATVIPGFTSRADLHLREPISPVGISQNLAFNRLVFMANSVTPGL